MPLLSQGLVPDVGLTAALSIHSNSIFRTRWTDLHGLLENSARRVYHPVAVALRPFLKALLFMLLLALTVPGCATTRSQGGWAGSRVTRGLIEVDPASSSLVLVVAGVDLAISARPELREELERLPGAFIAVTGRRSESAIQVQGYQLLEAPDGLAPLIGDIVVDQSGVMLEDEVTGSRLALRGAALIDLKRQHRARVWVTGSVVGPQVFLVAHWGLLVPAP
jgi:hypothetical protein